MLQKSGPITPVDPNCGSKGVLSDRKKDFIRKRVLQGLAASDSPGKTCVDAYAIQSMYIILLCVVIIRYLRGIVHTYVWNAYVRMYGMYTVGTYIHTYSMYVGAYTCVHFMSFFGCFLHMFECMCCACMSLCLCGRRGRWG